MEGTESFCMLVSDAEGRVMLQTGELAQAAGDGRPSGPCTGLTWREALAGLIEPELLPATLPDEPASYALHSVHGERLQMHAVPLPRDCGDAHILLVQRRGVVLSPRAQHLSTLGMLAAGVAHQMNNLLTVASGWLELGMAEEQEAQDRLQSLRKVAAAVDQLSGLSQNLLNLARARSGRLRRLNINELVGQVLDLVEYQIAQGNIELRRDLTEDSVVVQGDEGELYQVLLNLIMNAYQAMPSGGCLRVTTDRVDKWAVVEVKDTGGGIPAELQERIFAPFFTTRRGEGGSGLGLSVCKEVAERHDGELVVSSDPGAGTLVVLRVPLLRKGVAVADG